MASQNKNSPRPITNYQLLRLHVNTITHYDGNQITQPDLHKISFKIFRHRKTINFMIRAIIGKLTGRAGSW